jgi:hypothetical protein
MAIIQLPTDFQDLLKCLNKNAVEYLLIGGYAVGFYGYVRATGDIDFWFARTEENASRIVLALEDDRDFSLKFNPPGGRCRWANTVLQC